MMGYEFPGFSPESQHYRQPTIYTSTQYPQYRFMYSQVDL